MLGKTLFLLFLVAAIRSLIRLCKARRFSDGLFALFWLSLAASSFIESRFYLAIPITLLIIGTVIKRRESALPLSFPSEPSSEEEAKPFRLSEPSPSRPIGRPDSKYESEPGEPSPEQESEEPPEDEEESFIERIPELAEQWVTYGRIKGRTFDYDPATLESVDELISEEWSDTLPLFPDVTIAQLGSYVGETIRRKHGGKWAETEEAGVHLVGVDERDFKAFPFTKARNRIHEGEGDSVAFFYRALVHLLERESEEEESGENS